ncbi:cytochrome c oxidase assembly protein [Methylobrevis albus]|uniref:Cytochrome c oxidase assembly protein n=1 Tax=Methylobrevis albus TaxID=2793297 RepID=A0A931I311_9HYPH|nr:cytochrome c oxidase assembly protein [Methylobrevis albus]MBH0238368.1 cytochrome c oxidase assembly protein [Methylobrevis albus]
MNEIYCGPAPTPSILASAWNLDFAALSLCAAIVGAWAVLRRGQGGDVPLAGGIAVLLILFLTPLCALTAALFSARALHHVLLVALAAPLLALAFPASVRGSRIGLGWVAAIHALVFWVWHAPSVYAVAVTDPLGYWAMQLSLLGTAVWFWRRVFRAAEPAIGVVLALLGTTAQMGLLGALLTFAATPLYALHAVTTLPFGLSALEDQQLGGILMWVPAALPYLAAALYRAWPLLGPSRGGAPWSG